MKSGVCPKCGARDIRIEEGRWNARNLLSLKLFSWRLLPLRVQNYICTSCGYLENYLRTEDLEAVAKEATKFDHPRPSKSKLQDFE